MKTIHKKTFLPSLFGLMLPLFLSESLRKSVFSLSDERTLLSMLKNSYQPDFQLETDNSECQAGLARWLKRSSEGWGLSRRFKNCWSGFSTLMIREILWRIFQSESNEPEALYLNAGFEGILGVGELTNFQTSVQPNKVMTVRKIAWWIVNISALTPNSHGPTICPESRKIDRKVVARAITSGKIL